MERVVYLLGAGFSAPLGLPVVRNFLHRAKDLYFANPDKFAYFNEVFGRIDQLARLKNVFHADLLDIEEILSILEMEGEFAGGVGREKFVSLIRDVITAYTPRFAVPNRPGNWAPFAFGNTAYAAGYGYFVADLCGFQLEYEQGLTKSVYRCRTQTRPDDVRYGVITLNYDQALESVWDYIRAHYETTADCSFLLNAIDESTPLRCSLAKLHGTVETGDLIPPTSAKRVTGTIKAAWETAFKLLEQANHIRVMGYSLPTTDTMVRYLLKAALARAPHLKSFHVLCKDDEQHSVQSRYDAFVAFKFYRFRGDEVERYLTQQRDNSTQGGTGPSHTPGQLERTHRGIFG